MRVSITKKHRMILETPPEGRYLIELRKVEEKKNRDNTGTNAVVEFEIADGDYTGKPLRVYASLSNDFGIATLGQIYSALTGDYSEEAEFDLEDYIGDQCIGEIEHELYEGKKQARLNGFLPLKNPETGAATPTSSPF